MWATVEVGEYCTKNSLDSKHDKGCQRPTLSGDVNSSSDEELCTASIRALILKLQPLSQALIMTVVKKWSGRILLDNISFLCTRGLLILLIILKVVWVDIIYHAKIVTPCMKGSFTILL